MSNRSQYNSIKRRLGSDSSDISTRAAQFSFEMLDNISEGTTESILMRMSGRISSRDLDFDESEAFVLGHAAKGTEWSKVQSELKEIKDESRNTEELLSEILFKI